MSNTTTPKLWGIFWEESERGWGTRPDGYSFHRTYEDALEYVQEYNLKLPKDHIPTCYSRAVTKPTLIKVSQELYDRVQSMKQNGIWLGLNNESQYKTYTFKK